MSFLHRGFGQTKKIWTPRRRDARSRASARRTARCAGCAPKGASTAATSGTAATPRTHPHASLVSTRSSSTCGARPCPRHRPRARADLSARVRADRSARARSFFVLHRPEACRPCFHVLGCDRPNERIRTGDVGRRRAPVRRGDVPSAASNRLAMVIICLLVLCVCVVLAHEKNFSPVHQQCSACKAPVPLCVYLVVLSLRAAVTLQVQTRAHPVRSLTAVLLGSRDHHRNHRPAFSLSAPGQLSQAETHLLEAHLLNDT